MILKGVSPVTLSYDPRFLAFSKAERALFVCIVHLSEGAISKSHKVSYV